MSAFHDVILAGASGSQGYQISRSVRLRSSASAYFNRTPASAGNRQKFTWSGWVKRGSLGVSGALFSRDQNGSGQAWAQFNFNGSDQLNFINYSTVTDNIKTTTRVFRDPSAWYHLVLVFDSTNATAADRIQIWVNGVRETSFVTSTDPSLNYNSYINESGQQHNIGSVLVSSRTNYFNGYLTEINFIDGQALTPSSFGETDSITGVWKPKKYAGTYGTNGFYLNFSDNSNNTAATIGKDYSGNGNNWTPNNISVTAGATYDSMIDTPTPYADGGTGRGNYATWNPLDKRVSGTSTFANGNLDATVGASASTEEASATITFPSSGSWYCEITCSNVASGNARIGIGNSATAIDLRYASGYLYQQDGQKYVLGTASAYGASYTTGDVIGVAFDASSGSITFYKNNTSQGSITGISTSSIWVITATGKATVWIANFGQRPFSYTPPTGFKALNTQNLPVPTIAKGANYFAATTYTGTGASRSVDNTVNGVSFQPDFVWVKGRSGATDHALYDAVRGVQLQLESNTTTAETTETTGLTAFNSNGFTVGALAQMNTNTATYVGWQWKEGATQGFDIVTYTGTGVARTVAHSLGVAPKMIIVKARNSTGDWQVYTNTTGAGNFLLLNSTAASSASSTKWNNTAPTSSVFSVGVDTTTNMAATTYVAYLFSEVASFSRMGSYQGNGSSDGPFVFCGFRPRWLMVKITTTAGYYWMIKDSSRDPYNTTSHELYANVSDAEYTASSYQLDFLSNGFKIKNSGQAYNGSGDTYIYAAFSEVGFKYALGR